MFEEYTYMNVVNILLVLFTISLGLILALLLSVRPKGRLEIAITIKAASYFVVMLRGCAVTFFGLERGNLLGVVCFAAATLATVWYGICCYHEYWLVTRRTSRLP